jgi:SET domain-containing protein
MEKVEVRKAKNGMGVFAANSFHKDEVIFEIKGTLISCDQDENLDERTRSNTFRFDENWYLSPTGEIGDFLNHSCEPNSAMVKKGDKLYIVAAKQIENGEEITIDYSTIIASDDDWIMKCNCGSRNCRGVIGQFQNLPEEKKQEYLLLKMVPEYILLR